MKKLAPIHPGEILRSEFIEPLKMSQNQLAMELRVPVTRISEIVKGKRAITAETALRLGRYFGTSPDLWLGLQTTYDLEMTADAKAAEITRDVHPRTLAAV